MSIAYYSSNVFLATGATQVGALASSIGFGALNWLFALPAVFTVSVQDTFHPLTFIETLKCRLIPSVVAISCYLHFHAWRSVCLSQVSLSGILPSRVVLPESPLGYVSAIFGCARSL